VPRCGYRPALPSTFLTWGRTSGLSCLLSYLLLCLLAPATAAQAAEPALFTPARSLSALEHATAPPPEVPTIVTQSFQTIEELPPGNDATEPISAVPDEIPTPAEELPQVSGRPPPPTETPIPGATLDERDQPLTLCEVLASVMRHYPLLQAVERERGIAAGRLTSAMGAFDTNVVGSGNALAPGTYENYRSDFGLSQLMPQGGVTMFGGYRTGFGDFPTYNLKQLTADAGEVRGGLNVPLAKNRDIDKARASRAQAQLDVSLAEPVIQRTQLDYMRAAARSYWYWSGSGERYRAADYLVDLATERDVELALRVERGAMANIERVDNQQNIALRQGVVVQADRAVQEATINLSLFYRDDEGKPITPGRRRMRPMPAPFLPSPAMFEQSLARALAQRPEFQRLAIQREKLIIERRLAQNQTLPGLDAQLAGNQDAGFGKSSLSGPNGLDRQVLEATLIFQMPAQRREARGRVQATQAQLIQIERQLQYANDQVRAEVQDTFSALERAYEFHEQVKDRVELSRTVARAEREQLRLGRSDVLRVTLREQAKFEAELFEIAARQEFWRAESDLRAADASLGPESCGFADGLLKCEP
jgi:cobalt-zinc-cadmium efflux system outer membrane protein